MRSQFMAFGLVTIVASLGYGHLGFAQSVGPSVFGNGGGDLSGAAHRLRGTLGQPVVGVTTGPAPLTNLIGHGWWCVAPAVVVGVEDEMSNGRPVSFGRPSPNPASGQITLGFHLPRPARVELAVFDVRGARVATLVRGLTEAGTHTVRWAGDDDQGRRRGSGVYFAAFSVDGRSLGSRRIVVLR